MESESLLKNKTSFSCQSFTKESPVLMINGNWTHLTVLPLLTFSWVLAGRSREEGNGQKKPLMLSGFPRVSLVLWQTELE